MKSIRQILDAHSETLAISYALLMKRPIRNMASGSLSGSQAIILSTILIDFL